MEIRVKRFLPGHESTVGEMFVDGTYLCYTLADFVQPGDSYVYGKSYVPAGRYRVVVTYSHRFGRELPLLVDVPGFSKVRIAPDTGNDTHGCIVVGHTRDGGTVGQRRSAFNALLLKIRNALFNGEEVFITYGS